MAPNFWPKPPAQQGKTGLFKSTERRSSDFELRLSFQGFQTLERQRWTGELGHNPVPLEAYGNPKTVKVGRVSGGFLTAGPTASHRPHLGRGGCGAGRGQRGAVMSTTASGDTHWDPTTSPGNNAKMKSPNRTSRGSRKAINVRLELRERRRPLIVKWQPRRHTYQQQLRCHNNRS